MSLAGEEEKETCTGKRLRSHDSTTAWGSSSSDAADAAGETERMQGHHMGSMQHVVQPLAAWERGTISA